MEKGRNHPVALLRLGFRPFYLLAALYAVLAVPGWILMYLGVLPQPASMPSLFWHIHEMLFAFVGAIITGFLFTAVPNWTGRQTPTGTALALLALVWLAGRVLLYVGGPALADVAVIIDGAFLFLVSAALAWPVWQSRNYRNFGVVGIVLLIAVANLLFDLVVTGRLAVSLDRILFTGLNAIILIMVVIAGRVIPFFTGNALPEADVARIPWLDRLAVATVLLLLVVDALVPAQATLVAAVALLAAAGNGWRMHSWAFTATLKRPILWILHVGYAWIVIGLVLKGLAGLVDWIPRQAVVHSITVGAIGSLTLGMMTRTALGHSGRPLVLPPSITWCYLLINLAAVIRVAGAFTAADTQRFSLILSSLAWALAYLVYVIVYWPILTRPRVDGRPG